MKKIMVLVLGIAAFTAGLSGCKQREKESQDSKSAENTDTCKYDNYVETYNKDGFIVLRKKDKDTGSVSLSSGTKSIFELDYDSTFGKKMTKDDALKLIQVYQVILGSDDRTTRYVDFYFDSFYNYLNEIKATAGTASLTDLGLRMYYGFHLHEGKSDRHVIIAPLLKRGVTDEGKPIVEPLWISQPNRYSAYNFGSCCPDNCTNNDITGYKWPL